MKAKRKKKWVIIAAVATAVLLIVYWILIYFLVSAALVPSFMEKLDAFEDITVESYSQQVQTEDIIQNEEEKLNLAVEWFRSHQPEKVRIVSEDGYRLIAAKFLQEEESNKWALLLHGYTGIKEEMYTYAYWYYQEGFNILVPDFRCQGESDGDFIGMGYTDCDDCMLWLHSIIEENQNAEVIIHGESMGAATALIMTGDSRLPKNVKAVISDCAYTDAYSMFKNKCKEWFHLPSFPIVDSACLMLKLRGGYDLKKASAIEAVKRSKTPTIFIHGDQDALIDVGMSKELYEAAACKKELWIVEGAGHAQSCNKDPEAYYEHISRFIEEYISE